MRLARLRAENFRCIASVALEPSGSLNVIVGPNGSGKTSLLEAINLLSTARSFRSRDIGEVITHGADGLRVFGEVVGEDGGIESIGIEKTRKATRIRVSEADVYAASALARLLPVLLLSPDSQRLLQEGGERRRLMDWALFHVEPDYLRVFQRFQRALRQRNALLKGGGGVPVLSGWDTEVAASGEQLHRFRASYAVKIGELIGRLAEELVGKAVAMEYVRGWAVERSLGEVLAATVDRDLRRGFTGAGPQRADLKLSVGGPAARAVLSRGEGKLLVAAFALAHVAFLTSETGRVPVVLVDDVGSELDGPGRERLLGALVEARAQTFATAVELETVRPPGEFSLFHVERGVLREMV